MISNSHIQDLAIFDYLLCEEMYALRRTFGYDWLGKPDITSLSEKHINERNRINELLKVKYNSNENLSDYLYNYIMIDVIDRFSIFKSIAENNITTEDEKIKYDVLKKFLEYKKTYEKEFENKYGWVPSLHVVKIELENYRIHLQKIYGPKLNINYQDIKECCICFDSEKINCITNCKHQFHKSCIEIWTSINNCCPVCRQDLPEIINLNIMYLTEV